MDLQVGDVMEEADLCVCIHQAPELGEAAGSCLDERPQQQHMLLARP